jgi:hypothetical protein
MLAEVGSDYRDARGFSKGEREFRLFCVGTAAESTQESGKGHSTG